MGWMSNYPSGVSDADFCDADEVEYNRYLKDCRDDGFYGEDFDTWLAEKYEGDDDE